MDIGQRVYDMTLALGFERVSGTLQETKAAMMIKDEAEKLGVAALIDEFPAESGAITRQVLKVIAPYEKEYEVKAYLRSVNTPVGGAEYDLIYAEGALEANLVGAKGKFAIVNQRPTIEPYGRLAKAGVAGFISAGGEYFEDPNEMAIDEWKLRASYTDKHGSIMGMHVRAKDAMEMVRLGASRVRVEIAGESFDVTSRNVVAEIEGSELPDEIVSFGAHYDSVRFSPGVYDNASGSAIILELLRYFAANRPRRTVKFMWYGSEEQGLIGSKHYVAANADELSRHKLMINVDLAGTIMGSNRAIVTGPEAAVSYLDGVYKECGFAVDVKHDIYSSDCIPFADAGVPAISLLRAGSGGASYIHCCRDLPVFISAKSLGETVAFVTETARRVVNAPVMPIERKIPKDIKEKVDKYLFREPKQDK